MLYVSRFAGRYCYGVVDTDDGIEEIVASYDIVNAVSNLGMTILGVHTDSLDSMAADSILPYQDVSTMTSLQIKTNLLQHVEVITYGDMIVNVRFRKDEITTPPAIRVSDFGTVCGDRMFYGNRPAGVYKITIILDDKLSFSDYTFQKPIGFLGSQGIGIIFDLRDVTDGTKLLKIYKALVPGHFNHDMMDSIIDFEERKKSMFLRVKGTEV